MKANGKRIRPLLEVHDMGRTIVKAVRRRRQEIAYFIIEEIAIGLYVYTIYGFTGYLTRLSADQTMGRLMLT
jgi:hypothetical protein